MGVIYPGIATDIGTVLQLLPAAEEDTGGTRDCGVDFCGYSFLCGVFGVELVWWELGLELC